MKRELTHEAIGTIKVPGGDSLPIEHDGHDEPPYGFVVVVLNVHGVAEAFGPYDEDEGTEVAEFASKLVPTWGFHLDGHDMQRYGSDGLSADQPARATERPTRPRRFRPPPPETDTPEEHDA